MLLPVVYSFLAAITAAHAFSPIYLACQLQKPLHLPSKLGCPLGTIYVSATDRDADFHTITDAINSVSKHPNTAITVLIGAGEYQETVNITRRGPTTFLGQLNPSSFAPLNYSKPVPRGQFPTHNLVKIWNTGHINSSLVGQDDADTVVFTVAPSRAGALIGAGPTGPPIQPLLGSSDFKAYNLDIENRASDFYPTTQALATDVSYANASFYGCNIASYQDTWYTGRNASTYVYGGAIYGQTDYLFGFGTAYFEHVTFAERSCGGGLVAWKGTNKTGTFIAPGNKYGAYIDHGTIIHSPDSNLTFVGKCSLGRPWNDLAVTVYMNTYMDASILPAGFTPWSTALPIIDNNTYYAEYNSSGPGYNASARVTADHILTAEQAKQFSVENIFDHQTSWIDFTYQL